MPDLYAHEFSQIHEAIDLAWKTIQTLQVRYPSLMIPKENLQKIEQARELMADLAKGNSR